VLRNTVADAQHPSKARGRSPRCGLTRMRALKPARNP
jgi:hypothetical protein